MYSKNQISQQCIVCNQKINPVQTISLLKGHHICYDCFQKFKVIHEDKQFLHHHMHIFYEYNSFFRSLLFQYKGLGDYALKDAFLDYYKDLIKRKYKGYKIVIVPSNPEDNKRRGFSPMKSIAKTIGLDLFEGIYKVVPYKQSDLPFSERLKVDEKLGINDGELLKGKKIIILDDVITSGSTLKSCVRLCEANHPKEIEILVLSKVKDE